MSETPTKLPKFKSIMLVNSIMGEHKSFSGIPLTEDCPFVELMYDPEKKFLAVISKTKKNVFHFMPRLDEKGFSIPVNKHDEKQGVKQQRIEIETFHEYYLITKEEITAFLEMYAVNPKFDYKSML